VNWDLTDNQGTVRDVAEYNAATQTTSVVNHLVYASYGQITSQTNSTYQRRSRILACGKTRRLGSITTMLAGMTSWTACLEARTRWDLAAADEHQRVLRQQPDERDGPERRRVG